MFHKNINPFFSLHKKNEQAKQKLSDRINYTAYKYNPAHFILPPACLKPIIDENKQKVSKNLFWGALLFSRGDLAFINLCGLLSSLLKVLHVCYFATQNNKRIVFVGDARPLVQEHQQRILNSFINSQVNSFSTKIASKLPLLLPYSSTWQKERTFAIAKARFLRFRRQDDFPQGGLGKYAKEKNQYSSYQQSQPEELPKSKNHSKASKFKASKKKKQANNNDQGHTGSIADGQSSQSSHSSENKNSKYSLPFRETNGVSKLFSPNASPKGLLSVQQKLEKYDISGSLTDKTRRFASKAIDPFNFSENTNKSKQKPVEKLSTAGVVASVEVADPCDKSKGKVSKARISAKRRFEVGQKGLSGTKKEDQQLQCIQSQSLFLAELEKENNNNSSIMTSSPGYKSHQKAENHNNVKGPKTKQTNSVLPPRASLPQSLVQAKLEGKQLQPQESLLTNTKPFVFKANEKKTAFSSAQRPKKQFNNEREQKFKSNSSKTTLETLIPQDQKIQKTVFPLTLTFARAKAIDSSGSSEFYKKFIVSESFLSELQQRNPFAIIKINKAFEDENEAPKNIKEIDPHLKNSPLFLKQMIKLVSKTSVRSSQWTATLAQQTNSWVGGFFSNSLISYRQNLSSATLLNINMEPCSHELQTISLEGDTAPLKSNYTVSTKKSKETLKNNHSKAANRQGGEKSKKQLFETGVEQIILPSKPSGLQENQERLAKGKEQMRALAALTANIDLGLISCSPVAKKNWAGKSNVEKERTHGFRNKRLLPNFLGLLKGQNLKSSIRSKRTRLQEWRDSSFYKNKPQKWHQKVLNNCGKLARRNSKNAWLNEGDIVFFTNPEKNKPLLSQINRLKIPTIGIVNSGSALSKTVFRSVKGYSASSYGPVIDYPIIGNSDSLNFLRLILTKIAFVLNH